MTDVIERAIQESPTSGEPGYPFGPGYTSPTPIQIPNIGQSGFTSFTSGATDYRLDPVQVIDLLDKYYAFSDYLDVVQFLKTDENVTTLLLEAVPRISDIFPSGIQASLSVDLDPEDGDEELRLTLHGEYKPEELARWLRDLDESWWLDAVPRAHGQLVVDIDYE